MDSAETEFRGRLFRHRFLLSSYFTPGSMLTGATAMAPVPPGATSAAGIPSGTLLYQVGGHPHTNATTAVAAMHLRDKPAHDGSSQMWPGTAYAHAGGPLLHSRGGQGLTHDGGQHGAMAVSMAELQPGQTEAMAVLRLPGRSVPQQQMRYAGSVGPHQYLHVHGAPSGVRMAGHEAAPHEGEHMGGGRYAGAGQHAQRGARRPNSAMSAPSPGMQQIIPPTQSMHADALHQRSMPGSPTECGVAREDMLPSYAAAAASEAKRDDGGGGMYDGFRGRNSPHMGPAQGHRAGTRQRSATQLTFGPQPPPPPQPSGRQISPEGVYVHVDSNGGPHTQALHLQRGPNGGGGHTEGGDSRGIAVGAHQSDPHGFRQAGQYFEVRGAPVGSGAQHLPAAPTFYVQAQQRGGAAATAAAAEVPAGMQQITAIGLPSAAAQGATFAGHLVQGTPIMVATGQGMQLAHGAPQQPHHAQQRPQQQQQQQQRGAAIGASAMAGQHDGGHAPAAAPQRSAAGALIDAPQPVPIQLGEHQRELFTSAVDPVYSHLIRTVHPPFNSVGV